ncbi:MAG: AAA family ATPase [Acidimicrobiia bacterium]
MDKQTVSTTFVSRPRDDERTTRKPLGWWDRSKILVFLAALFFFYVWMETSNNPLLPVSEAFRTTFRLKWWLPALFGIELLRQLHFVLAEHWSAYYLWWQRRFEHNDARIERISPWTRYRLSRVAKVVFWIALLNAFVAWRNQEPFVRQLVDLPATVSDFLLGTAADLPMIFSLALTGGIIIGQFALLFWFMSRGGTEVYYPDDVKTRFVDVWGQDQVLEKVKENLVLLEDPGSIEKRGGHVPSGILLYGPPGTGKTLMAEAVAGETGKPYVFVEPGAFMNMFMGVGVLKVRSLFKKLRKLAMRFGGVIVFFDEADALGNRGGVTGGAPAASPVQPDSCNGFSYLSEPTRLSLRESALQATPATADPERGIVHRVVMGGLMGGGGGDPMALQALLAELSGLKKPRGFFNRYVRRVLGMRPKPPPKYRILIMMATNRADSLDAALLRPGRVDRIYKVGYPSKEGRKRTFEGYLSRVKNVLTDDDVEQLAVTSPYATGATIKDTVNEALVSAIRDGREAVTWPDILKAKHQKLHGLPDDFEYIERERHAVAIHEACHAIGAYRLKRGSAIDVATIERRGDTGGFVSYIPLEDRFTAWRSDREADIMVSLASLAGERLFFDGDNSTGVGGDMGQATTVAMEMEGFHAMGATVASHRVTKLEGTAQPTETGTDRMWLDTEFGRRVEARLEELLQRSQQMLERDRIWVLALAHALEAHRTIPGEDVAAIIDGRPGAVVDGRIYHDPVFQARLEEYHEAALAAHRGAANVEMDLPDSTLNGRVPTAAGNGNGSNGNGAVVGVPNRAPVERPYEPPVEARYEPPAEEAPYEPPRESYELMRAEPPASNGDTNGNGKAKAKARRPAKAKGKTNGQTNGQTNGKSGA